MKRLSSLPELPKLHSPAFNRLHHICLLWIDYLRVETEAEKQELLCQAVSHIVLLHPQGDEGEEVVAQVWQAVHRRGRAYIETDAGQNYVVAADGGKFAMFASLTGTKIPVQPGIWEAKDGSRLNVYRVEKFARLLCISATDPKLPEITGYARDEAEEWEGHLPCDTKTIRKMGPWNYICE